MITSISDTARRVSLVLAVVVAGCGTPVAPDPVDIAVPADLAVVDIAMVPPDLTPPLDLAPLCRRSGDCGGAPHACCGAACVDTSSDAANCGACGIVCAAGKTCCGGNCVDLTADPGNCGACATACMSPNAAGSCAASMCGAGACKPGWGDCNMDKADGCETNLRTDVKNCKACGTACATKNGVSGCDDNGCYLKACNFGYDDCNMDQTDGCEASVLSDSKNCGACGSDCNNPAVPHARAGCNTAQCQLTSCDQGWANCDGLEKNGCETSTITDSNNCGACNNKCQQGLVCKGGGCTCPNCAIPNASAKCINFICIFDKCNPGSADCDMNIKNGCETDVSSDANNCGGCGVVCPNNLPHCVNSVCVLAPVFVGKYDCGKGPAWGGNPPTYTCQEACAFIFGGVFSDYNCSTQQGQIDHQANSSIWGIGGCHIVAEDFKINTFYNCGKGNCAQSSYVQDNCIQNSTNYCFK